MDDSHRSLTEHELWQALYDQSSGQEVAPNESASEDEDGSLLDDQEEHEFIQEEPEGEVPSEEEALQESMSNRTKLFGRNSFI